MRSKKQGPKPGAEPKALKRPKLGNPLDDDPTMVWGFGMIDLDGPFGWKAASEVHVDFLYEKFQSWETMKAGDLFGRGGNKLIPLRNLCPQAKKRLAQIDRDDLDGLWELRAKGVQRVWGHRMGHVFYLIWWDPDHQVCRSSKS